VKSEQENTHTKERTRNPKGGDFITTYILTNSTTDHWPLAQLQDESQGLGYCNTAPDSYKDFLKESIALLGSSPSARLMIREASHLGWKLGISDRTGHDFHLDVPEKQIFLDNCGLSPAALARSGYFRHKVLISLVRALRDAWQEKRHGGFDTHYGPENILLLERVRAADCDVISMLVAWELRGEGFGDVWRHLLGSEEGDMALSYAACLEHDPASHFTGKALQAAFNQWFRSDLRVNASDHETLEYIDMVMADNPANPFGKHKLTPVGVEILSCLPDKTAYLRGLGRDLMAAPLYAGMNDFINQSHLMQILHDQQVIFRQGVPFRDAGLAEKIFPDGQLTLETASLPKS
jgi:hypothetical protein